MILKKEEHKFSCFFDLVLPWQSFAAIFWFFSGVLLSVQGNFRNPDASIVLVLIAILSARFAGMCLNRLIDKEIDAKNPRTQNRTLPAGKTTVKNVAWLTFLLVAIFFGACYLLPPIGIRVGLFVGFWILVYSYMKRFTYLCHFVLGIIHGMIPIVGSLWITGTCTLPVLLLGAGAFCSISGTDIMYSLQDEEFDRSNNLKSIPSRFGRKKATVCSLLLHMISLILIGVSFFLGSMLCAFYVWILLSCFLCVLWYFFLKNTYDSFPYFMLFFPSGAFFSLGVNYLWRALS